MTTKRTRRPGRVACTEGRGLPTNLSGNLQRSDPLGYLPINERIISKEKRDNFEETCPIVVLSTGHDAADSKIRMSAARLAER